MRKFALGLGVALLPFAAHADYRTVDWFVAHPREAQGVIALCHNHAGLAPRNPNCTNAEEAQNTITLRNMAAGLSATDPRYWVGNSYLALQLRICSAYRPTDHLADTVVRICAAARAAQ